MARRLRIQYPDAIYHVMARGNGRQDIVADDADRERLVACLERAVRRSGGKFGVLQPIMPLDLPVKVRPWELTVYPRSHIRR